MLIRVLDRAWLQDMSEGIQTYFQNPSLHSSLKTPHSKSIYIHSSDPEKVFNSFQHLYYASSIHTVTENGRCYIFGSESVLCFANVCTVNHELFIFAYSYMRLLL